MPKGTVIKQDEKELARALLAMGRSYREVAEAMELSVGSVHNIAREPMERIEPVLQEIRRRFAMKHWMLADHILGNIDARDLMYAGLKEKALAAAILTDKAMVLEKAMGRSACGPPPMPAEGEMPDADEVTADVTDEQGMNTPDEAKFPFTMQIPAPERD